MKLSDRELKEALLLYGVTDQSWLNGRSLEECVEQAILGGTTCIQLREKKLDHMAFVSLAQRIKKVCEQQGIPFLINDRIEVALEVCADGVHIGQDDISCSQARRMLGENALVGVSAQTVDEARKAEQEGADYLGVGALIATPTKSDAVIVSKEELQAICESVAIPVIGIGGLNQNTIAEFADTGIVGVAVVSALFDASDIESQARELRRETERAFRKERDER